MTKFRNVVFLSTALLIGAAGVTFAQETVKPAEDETAAPQTETASDVESQLSLGEDANAVPVVGQPYTKEIIGDWEMRCIKAEEGAKDPCQMYQLLDDGDGTPVAEFSLFRLPDGGKAKAGATVVVPLETSLPQQLTITVDGSSSRRYPYAFCNPVGCYARIGLTADDLAGFKRGNTAMITIVPAVAQDQKVELPLSLTGFTAAYDQVSTAQQ
ncbi:MAG: invasion protein IalB [Ascidiaceihabitans sp.]|jgi:invasion protein IalB|tara:strand:+ start:60 stop:698 length:639 start_codon:yes stop_codon:yes gene_type:complete